MKKKKLFVTAWRTYGIKAILSVLILGLSTALIRYTKPGWLSLDDAIQMMTLAILVIVTLFYAWSTHNIYKVALNAEKNAVFPIVNVTTDVISQDYIRVSYQNIGKGPALNFKIWVEREGEDKFLYLKSQTKKTESFRAAVGAGQSGHHEWVNSDGPLPTRNSGFDVVAEYTDVFQQVFVSKLLIIGLHDQEFRFGKKQ